MLLVVFGAGASYDSVASLPPRHWSQEGGEQNRPPLADELFDDRPRFGAANTVIEHFRPVLPLLRQPAVEQTMQRLQTEAATNPRRPPQLAAIKYYLQFTLWGISHDWHQGAVLRHGSNYETLLDTIDNYRKSGETVALVTFNYDLLIERALPAVDVHISALPDYIKSDYKLFKLHGSVNWGHPITTTEVTADQHFWTVLAYIIRRTADIKVADEFQMIDGHLLGGAPVTIFPAIAIPLQEKLKYECPAEHVEVLRGLLPQTTRVLMVGWRAMEVPFLDLLAHQLVREVHGLVVCGSQEGAESSIERLRVAGIDTSRFRPGRAGFSELALGDEIREFLK